jgi:hypothetical protein
MAVCFYASRFYRTILCVDPNSGILTCVFANPVYLEGSSEDVKAIHRASFNKAILEL